MKQNDQQEDNTSEKVGKHAELHIRDHFLGLNLKDELGKICSQLMILQDIPGIYSKS